MEGSTLLVYFCRNWTRLSQISSSTSSLLKCLTQFCCYFFCFVYALHLSTVTSVILSSQFPLDGVQSDYFSREKRYNRKGVNLFLFFLLLLFGSFSRVWMPVELFKPISLEIYRPWPKSSGEEDSRADNIESTNPSLGKRERERKRKRSSVQRERKRE